MGQDDYDTIMQQTGLERESVDYCIKRLLAVQINAQCEVSKRAVGAVVVAKNYSGLTREFVGCNMEFATSDGLHAEVAALATAITHGFTKPMICFVTSSHPDQRAAMCGACMQRYYYTHKDCLIAVVNNDGSINFVVSLRERNGKYAYEGGGRINHDKPTVPSP